MNIPDETQERMRTWLLTAGAVLAAVAVRKGVVWAWEAATHEEPPANPADPGVPWRQALAWSAAVGAAAGVARMLGRRGTHSLWERGSRRLGHAGRF